MRAVPLCTAWVLVACFATSGQPASDSPFVTPASLAQSIRRLQSSLTPQNARQILSNLPRVWRVRTAEREYSIQTLPPRALPMDESSPDTRMRSTVRAQQWLSSLATQLEA